MVTPRSGHVSILPHADDSGRAGGRCGYTVPPWGKIGRDGQRDRTRPTVRTGPSTGRGTGTGTRTGSGGGSRSGVRGDPARSGGGADGRRRAARAAIVEFSGEAPSVNTSAPDSRIRRRPPTASWPSCPAIAAGSGPSSSPHIQGRRTPPSAKSSWYRARPRCSRRSGCPGMSGFVPAISARAICWPRWPTIPVWCPATWPPATRQIDEVAAETRARPSSGAERCGARTTPRSAGTTATTDRPRRWPGDPADLPRLRFLPAAGRSARGDVRGLRQRVRADGHVVDAEYGCGAHSDTPAPAGTGSRCTSRTTTACSTWWRAPTGLGFFGGGLDPGQRRVHALDQFVLEARHAAEQRVDQEVRDRRRRRSRRAASRRPSARSRSARVRRSRRVVRR